MTEQMHSFGTDVSRLLDIVANALYSNRDVFLRELISNAADACDKLRYESLHNSSLKTPDQGFAIRIQRHQDVNALSVQDNGIGMDEQELIDNLGTIAKSGTAAMMDAIKASGQSAAGAPPPSLIGQFGVGFYASFMVADKVEVYSKKAGINTCWTWVSDGRTGYSVQESTPNEAALIAGDSGTFVKVFLKADATDFLIEDKIKQIVLAYSDHISFPIYIGNEDQKINAATALWMRPKNSIPKEDYTEFYHHIGHVFDDPLMTSHWRAEGKIEYTALLFIPTLRPWDLYDPGRKHAVHLYVKRVFITDQASTLIYPWLRFVRGVIDSEDLPLNISREMLQNNPLVTKIRSGVTKRILSDLSALADSDSAAYESFWYQFGMVLKEGLYDADDHRDDILSLCRFFSSASPKTLTSLKDYVSRMKEGQNDIYYITGEKRESLEHSPHLEGFKARGLEVLFLTDTVDSFWLQMVPAFEGKKFISITKGAVDLTAFANEAEKAPETADDSKDTEKPSLVPLLSALSDALKSEVKEVRLSTRLTESPVCLVASDHGVDMHMERVLKIQQNYNPNDTKRVLEINGSHPLILNLARIAQSNKDSTNIREAAQLLYDQACIIQGEPVADPSGFAKRMAGMMQKSLAA
jgi:molecular chaperone HtpG